MPRGGVPRGGLLRKRPASRRPASSRRASTVGEPSSDERVDAAEQTSVGAIASPPISARKRLRADTRGADIGGADRAKANSDSGMVTGRAWPRLPFHYLSLLSPGLAPPRCVPANGFKQTSAGAYPPPMSALPFQLAQDGVEWRYWGGPSRCLPASMRETAAKTKI